MEPEVSVVIPSYNHEAYVNEAVASALACDQLALEVVVVDDGSTDGSREALRVWDAEPRVRVEHQDNRGAHAALNRGCGLARGRLVFILNSDDAFHPDRIGRLSARLDAATEPAIAASFIEVVDKVGSTLGIKEAWWTLPPWQPPSPGPLISDLDDPRLALLETNWISTTSNLAFPTSLVRDHGLRFAALRYAHDWDFALSASHVGRIELVEEPLLRYRVHGANTIDEGGDEGREAMRFEIMWVVARHAARLIRATSGSRSEQTRLNELFDRSAPAFGRDVVLDQLLLLRGTDDEPPVEYDALTDVDHPFRRAAVEAGSESTRPTNGSTRDQPRS